MDNEAQLSEIALKYILGRSPLAKGMTNIYVIGIERVKGRTLKLGTP